MTNDSNLPGDDSPGPADGDADPTTASPAQPAEPHYTTGPGMPPERESVVRPAGGAVSSRATGGPPPWLIPTVVGVIAGLVVVIVAFMLLSGGDGDDSIASESSTTVPGPETTLADVTETTVPTAVATTAPDDTATTVPETTVLEPSATTVPEATETTVAAGDDNEGDDDGAGAGDGGEPGEDAPLAGPCADGYVEVSALPFGLCSQGEVVRTAQFAIALSAPIDVDGFYGPTSFAAVQDIQRGLGLEPDGIVTQELLDLLEAEGAAPELVVASPGTVRILDREYPIDRTCRTVPFEGRTGSYQVVSYVFRDDFGIQVLDRWSDEGGAAGAYFGESAPVTELSQGFGFEVVEGDTLLQVSVNPVDAPQDTCAGRVTESDVSGAQTRVYTVVHRCAAEGGHRLLLSENGRFSYRADDIGDGFVARFDAGIGGEFFFGEGNEVGIASNGAVQVVTVPIESGGVVRQLRAEFPVADDSSC